MKTIDEITYIVEKGNLFGHQHRMCVCDVIKLNQILHIDAAFNYVKCLLK